MIRPAKISRPRTEKISEPFGMRTKIITMLNTIRRRAPRNTGALELLDRELEEVAGELHLLGVGDLRRVSVEVVLHDRDANLCSLDLVIDRHDLPGGQIALHGPVLLAAEVW
jgi:hypothetical protein